MARFARVIAEGVAHHVTQRGNARRYILETDAERSVYRDLLQQGSNRHGVALIGPLTPQKRGPKRSVPSAGEQPVLSLDHF